MTRRNDVVPEEKQEAAPGISPAAGEREPVVRRLEPETGVERLRSLGWASVIGVFGTLSAAVFNVVGFIQTGAWQMLVVLAAMVVGGVGLVVSNRLAVRGRLETAATVLLLAMVGSFAAGELVHSGLTSYLRIGGLLLIVLVGVVFLPRQWPRWAVLAGGWLAYIELVNWLEPLPRYNLQQLGTSTNLYVYALLGFLFLAALFLLARVYQRLLSIRVRLPLSFALVVLVSVATIAVAGALVGSQTGQRQALRQMDLLARMKEAEIDDWLDRVDAELQDALIEGAVAPRLRLILQTRVMDEVGQASPDTYLQYVARESPFFYDFVLYDRDGRVRMFTAVNSDSPEEVREEDLRRGLEGFFFQPLFDAAQEDAVPLMAFRPVLAESGQSLGVLVGMVRGASLGDLLGERSWIGDTGETYLLDRTGRLLTNLRFRSAPQTALETELESAGTATGADTEMTYTDYRNQEVIGALHWLPRLDMMLVTKQDVSEFSAVTRDFMRVITLVAVGAFVVAVVVSLLLARSITLPLAELTATADRIAAGDLSLVPVLGQRDEIGTLSRAVASMTTQLRDMITTLEGRVAERTRELERRSAYLEASADVGRAASSILDPDKLMNEMVELIRERFGLYYVGLFLLDDTRQWAVLRAGTGRAGDLMLQRGHRIEVGKGLVGWSVARAQARVAEEMDHDAADTAWASRLATPELPDTRSEAALPLRSRDQTLGAITVQDTRAGAFDAEALAVLQAMADQMAVAIDNARLFEQSEQALAAQQEAYGEISREAWRRLIEARALRGYRCDQVGVVPVGEQAAPLVRQAAAEKRLVTAGVDGARARLGGNGGSPEDGPAHDAALVTSAAVEGQPQRVEMAVPVMLRDQLLGVLRLSKEEADAIPWSSEQLALAEGLAEQLGQALESARLYQDSVLRAGRERLAAGVTARMRESLNVDMVLQTAARELQAVFSLAEVELRIHGGAEPGGPLAGGQEREGL